MENKMCALRILIIRILNRVMLRVSLWINTLLSLAMIRAFTLYLVPIEHFVRKILIE